jgi:hypothetical protein
LKLQVLLSSCALAALTLVAVSDSETTLSQSKYRLRCEFYDWGPLSANEQSRIKAACEERFATTDACWTAANKIMRIQYRVFGRFSVFVACFAGNDVAINGSQP